MSALETVPVLEWSGGAVRAFDPLKHQSFMAESLEDAVAALGHPKAVGLAIGRRSSLVRQLVLPDVGVDQAEAIVRVQLDQLFPVSASELTSDFAFANRQNGTGKKVVVSAMRTDLLKQAKDELARLGVEAVWVAPVSAASGSVAQAQGLDSAVVVDESVDGTGIDIIQNRDVYYSRSAPSGLQGVDLDMEIQRTLASAKVSQSTILRTDQNGNLAALARQKPAVNLELYQDVVKRKTKAVKARRTLASLLVMAFACCALMVYFDFEDAAVRIKRNTDKGAREIKTLTQNKSLVTGRLEPLKNASATLESSAHPKQLVADVVSVVADHCPADVWLTGMTVERGRNMQIRGNAKNSAAVYAFMQALTADPRFRDTRLIFANDGKIGETPIVLFAATGHVVGNYPAYIPTAAKTKPGAKK